MRSHKSLITKPLSLYFVVGFFLFSLVQLCACGGSGGSDEFIGAAIVNISANPRNIDTGDRTQVSIAIDDVHTNGIALKILFPDGLEYVLDTSYLTVNGTEYDLGPAINMLSDDGVYLVFYLAQSYFGDNGDASGVLTIELEARDIIRSGLIEVDADVDDPTIDNAVEFDVNNPEFLAEDSAEIEVEG